jgi:hypothetical protein
VWTDMIAIDGSWLHSIHVLRSGVRPSAEEAVTQKFAILAQRTTSRRESGHHANHVIKRVDGHIKGGMVPWDLQRLPHGGSASKWIEK